MGALDGKVALITGAGAGIGRGIARRYAREGASVAVIEIDVDNGQRVAAELESLGARSMFVRTDVSRKSEVEAAFAATIERFGRLDVLVNNASKLSPNVLLEQKSDEMLQATLGAGAWATWWFMQLAMPVMRAQGGGRIVNFVSVDAEAGAWLHADYNMSKGAIEALTRSAAMEWGRFQILVNAIAPVAAGTVYEQLVRAVPGFEQMASAMNPLGRVGDPEEDIAPVAVFLASEACRYVTGEVIHVDGGMHVPRYHSKPQDLSTFTKA
jgi:NAD(P)-dependent dehydrogenase (short-subunit alcohol dehydrogenase family)